MSPLAELLASLRSELSGIKDQLTAIAKNKHADSKTGDAAPVVLAGVQAPVSVRIEKEPRDKYDKTIYGVHVVTAAAAILIVLLSLAQFGEMKSATESATVAANSAAAQNVITTNFFRRDQRPYLWIGDFDYNAPIVDWAKYDGRGVINFRLKYINSGKTPAQDVKVRAVLIVGSGADKTKRVLPPPRIDGPVAPGRSVDLTVFTTQEYSGEQAAMFRRLDRAHVVFGTIEYVDDFGTKYESGFCYWWLAAGKVEHCPDGNYMK